MRTASPAFSLNLGRGTRERAVLAGLHALAAVSAGLWGWGLRQASQGEPGWPDLMIVLLLAGLGLSGGVLGWWVLRPLQGPLGWDGQAWWHGAPERSCAVQLVWDAGPWVLLRVRAGSWRRPRWCGVSVTHAGPAWHGLRMALLNPQRAGAPAVPARASA